jgi:hypothetical protein
MAMTFQRMFMGILGFGIFALQAAAQGYVPTSQKAVGLAANETLGCNPIPSLTGGFSYHDSMMSVSAAAKAGILGFGGSGDAKTMVAVRDYAKTAQCTATDGKTTLLYGESVRTAIVIKNYNAAVNLNFAAIAANATLNNTSYDVSIETIGWNNPQAANLIATLAAKTLSVETYSDYNSVQSRLIALTTDPATTHTVTKLGVVSGATGSDPDLIERVATAYALQSITDGKSCQQAKLGMKNANDFGTAAVSNIYSLFGGACDTQPLGKPERDRAAALLNGLKIKY